MNLLVGPWSSLQPTVAPLRYAVFVEEQSVPEALEWDEDDATATHLALVEGDSVVACARLLPGGHIGRMAVDARRRREGLGSTMLRACLREAQRQGHATATLHAQCHARGFYEQHGFEAEGDVFDDAGIPHIAMRRRLIEPGTAEMVNT